MKYIIFTIQSIISLLLLNTISLAQDYSKTDSLKQILITLPAFDGTDADTIRLQALFLIAESYERMQPDSAIAWYSKIINEKNNTDDFKIFKARATIIATALKNCGYIENLRKNFEQAAGYFEKSLEISRQIDHKKEVAICAINIANYNRNIGNYYIAEKYYHICIDARKETGDKRGLGNVLASFGLMCWYQGNYSKAISCFEQSLAIREVLGKMDDVSACINNLGLVYWSMGNYLQAIDYFEKSFEIDEELGDIKGVSATLTNLGIVYFDLGDYTRALDYFNRSFKIDEGLNDTKGLSDCMINIGNVYSLQSNHEKALEYYTKSIQLAEQYDDKYNIANCFNNIGLIYWNKGDYPKASDYFSKSLIVRKEINDKKGMSTSYFNLGNVNSAMVYNSNYNLTERDSLLKISAKYFENSLKIKKEIGALADIALNIPSLAKVYIGLGMNENAYSLYLESLNLTIKLLSENFSILSEKEKELYLDKSKAIFNELHYFNIYYPEYNDSLSGICFNNELILKGLLLKSTTRILDVVYNSPDTDIHTAYFLMKQYRNQISMLQGAKAENADSLIIDLEKHVNELERKLVRLSTEFASIEKLFAYKWEDVQKTLNSGEAAIEFVSFTKGNKNDTTVYAALIITSKSKKPISVKLFEESDLQKILGKSTGTGYNYVNSLYGNNSIALYELIWKPIEPALKGVKTIYLAPVGVLNKIAFAALSKKPGKMLCDVYNFQQVSTTGKLIDKEKSETIKTAAIFGGIDYNPDTLQQGLWDYLPGTLVEKESIENQFQKNKIPYISYSGKEAIEGNFKALFDAEESPSLLHVSTHGFFFPAPENEKKEVETIAAGLTFHGYTGFGNWMFVNNKNPMMQSGLVFAGANRIWSEDWSRTDDEGILTAYEVSNLNMRNTQLVVLSACETGLGDIKGSEGVYGLQRALKMAGVKFVIMSLWQVPDKETVEFMETFYTKLFKIKDVRKSFTETQKEMRQKYDPYFWAAFVLVE